MLSGTLSELKEKQKKRLKTIISRQVAEDGTIPRWSHVYYFPDEKKWISYELLPFVHGEVKGRFFVNVDVSRIINSSLFDVNEDTSSGIMISMSLPVMYFISPFQKMISSELTVKNSNQELNQHLSIN